MKTQLLPYFDERPTSIDTLVLHCSAQDTEAMVAVLRQEQLSAHYIIGLAGKIVQLVPEEKRAWHAGISSWRGRENINHNSIGIEISSLSMGQEPYAECQIKSLITLCRDIINRHHISPQNVVGHSDIAPTRKPDPGKAFPWQRLAQEGIGLWYDLAAAENISEDNTAVLLRGIGYDASNLAAASYAFCRHFIPDIIPKTADIHGLIKCPFPQDFVLPQKYVPILKACYAAYIK